MRQAQLIILAFALAIFLRPAMALERDRVGKRDALPRSAQLTVLYDAFGRNPKLEKDWGYAALVEFEGRRILFDTGNDPSIFERNVRALGVDLTTLDLVVVSHRHGDHTTGLAYLLSVNPNVQIYAPKESFGVFGSSVPSTFYQKDPSLPPERQYFDGAPPATIQSGKAWPGANVRLVDQTTEIAPGVHVIALVSDKPGTLELKELSLAIETPEGIVLIVGCSHPGIERIVAAAAAIDRRIHIVAGGLHLVASSAAEIERLMTALRDTYDVAWIAPGHCTGEPAFAAITRHFGDRSIYAGLGTTIGLGSKPRTDLDHGSRYALSADDLATYRTALRNSMVRFGRSRRSSQ